MKNCRVTSSGCAGRYSIQLALWRMVNLLAGQSCQKEKVHMLSEVGRIGFFQVNWKTMERPVSYDEKNIVLPETDTFLRPGVSLRPNISRFTRWIQIPLSIYSEVLAGLNLYLDFAHCILTVVSLGNCREGSKYPICSLMLWRGTAAVTDFAVDTVFFCSINLLISLWYANKWAGTLFYGDTFVCWDNNEFIN